MKKDFINHNWTQQKILPNTLKHKNELACFIDSNVTLESRLGDLLDFGQLFKAFGNN